MYQLGWRPRIRFALVLGLAGAASWSDRTAAVPSAATLDPTSLGDRTWSDARLGFTTVSAGGDHTCGVAVGGAAYCWGTKPIAVAGGLRLTSVSAGDSHTCGLASGGKAFCWGSNVFGQLGNATTADSPESVAVEGGVAFAAVSAGGSHTCGLTLAGAVYCWGRNDDGELGLGTVYGPEVCSGSSCSTVPRAVLGGLTFAVVGAGSLHTCGLTIQEEAHCWGDNALGQLGNGTMTDSSVPVTVAGGLVLATLATGSVHNCVVTATAVVYCWGDNRWGELGIGTSGGPDYCRTHEACSTVPMAIVGGLTFATISAGGHTCALTPAGAAYCWGLNASGQLGTGTSVGPEICYVGSGAFPYSCSTTPVRVSGGLSFGLVTTGSLHACALTGPRGAAYCWGDNSSNQLGINEAVQFIPKPAPVAAP